MVQGKCAGSLNVAAPVATNNCGTLLSFRYCRIATFVGVPRVWNRNATCSCSMRRRTCSTVLLVDHLEVGRFRPPDHAIGRERSAVGHGLADLDLGIGNTWRIAGPRGPEALGGMWGGGRSRLQQKTTRNHVIPP